MIRIEDVHHVHPRILELVRQQETMGACDYDRAPSLFLALSAWLAENLEGPDCTLALIRLRECREAAQWATIRRRPERPGDGS